MTGEERRLGGPCTLNVSAMLDKAGEVGHQFIRKWFDGRISPTLSKSRRERALEQLAAVDAHLAQAERGLVVMVTHDWNLLAVGEELFGMRHEEDRWPGLMDGLVIWRADGHLHVGYGDHIAMITNSESPGWQTRRTPLLRFNPYRAARSCAAPAEVKAAEAPPATTST